jgi:hypothetical protein
VSYEQQQKLRRTIEEKPPTMTVMGRRTSCRPHADPFTRLRNRHKEVLPLDQNRREVYASGPSIRSDFREYTVESPGSKWRESLG